MVFVLSASAFLFSRMTGLNSCVIGKMIHLSASVTIQADLTILCEDCLMQQDRLLLHQLRIWISIILFNESFIGTRYTSLISDTL